MNYAFFIKICDRSGDPVAGLIGATINFVTKDPGVGFPRECGPRAPVPNKWAASSSRYPCSKNSVAFYLGVLWMALGAIFFYIGLLTYNEIK